MSRDDPAHGYSESLTYAWTDPNGLPATTQGAPAGTESLASSGQVLLSLSRSFTNTGGQTIESDSYFNVSGLDLADADQHPGTVNVNYYETTYAYNTQGLQDRTVSPTGTITRIVYDDLGRATATWIGTDDTHQYYQAWSPGNNGGNMVEVSANVYDNGGLGDGNLTRSSSSTGEAGGQIVTDYVYDWRNRMIASKSGVLLDGSGQLATTTETQSAYVAHRPITVSELDNLGETLASYAFDGDGIALSDFASGPRDTGNQILHAGRCPPYSTTAYDEQGRVYETQTYSVNPVTGALETTLLQRSDVSWPECPWGGPQYNILGLSAHDEDSWSNVSHAIFQPGLQLHYEGTFTTTGTRLGFVIYTDAGYYVGQTDQLPEQGTFKLALDLAIDSQGTWSYTFQIRTGDNSILTTVTQENLPASAYFILNEGGYSPTYPSDAFTLTSDTITANEPTIVADTWYDGRGQVSKATTTGQATQNSSTMAPAGWSRLSPSAPPTIRLRAPLALGMPRATWTGMWS